MKFKDGTEEEFYKAWNKGQVKRVHDGKRMVPEREWVGLTAEDIAILWKATPHIVGLYTYTDIAREIEAKLKEKNAND